MSHQFFRFFAYGNDLSHFPHMIIIIICHVSRTHTPLAQYSEHVQDASSRELISRLLYAILSEFAWKKIR